MSKKKVAFLSPLLWILLVGILVGAGFAFVLDKDNSTPGLWVTSIASALAAAYVVFVLIDSIRRGLAVRRDPLGANDVSDRDVAAGLAESLPCGALSCQARPLLAAWGAGATGPQVARMAASQLVRSILAAAFEGIAFFAILAVGLAAHGDTSCTCAAPSILAILVPVFALFRIQSAVSESAYLESALLARIGNDTPAAAATDFAQKASDAMASATAKLTDAQQSAASSVQSSTTALAEAQKKALAALAEAQTKSADAIAKAQSDAAASAAKAQSEAAESIAKGQAEIAKQLDRVTALASTIDNVLRLQQSVDGTLKDISAADEFKTTLLELKRHLAESDELIKTATKPRRIRFVENPAE